MKKITIILLAVFFLSQGAAYAGPFTKLGRGFTNVLTGFGEIPVQIKKLQEDNNIVTAFFGGFFKGITFGIAREVGGVYEIVTFLIPLPWRYKPLWQPATVFDVFHSDANRTTLY